jgi:hypothetical protein
VLFWYSFLVAEDVGNWENPAYHSISHNNPSQENLHKFDTRGVKATGCNVRRTQRFMTVRNKGERRTAVTHGTCTKCTAVYQSKGCAAGSKEVTTVTDKKEEGGEAKGSNECDSCHVLLRQD